MADLIQQHAPAHDNKGSGCVLEPLNCRWKPTSGFEPLTCSLRVSYSISCSFTLKTAAFRSPFFANEMLSSARSRNWVQHGPVREGAQDTFLGRPPPLEPPRFSGVHPSASDLRIPT